MFCTQADNRKKGCNVTYKTQGSFYHLIRLIRMKGGKKRCLNSCLEVPLLYPTRWGERFHCGADVRKEHPKTLGKRCTNNSHLIKKRSSINPCLKSLQAWKGYRPCVGINLNDVLWVIVGTLSTSDAPLAV